MASWPIRSSSSVVIPGRTCRPTSMSASAATRPAIRILPISSSVRTARASRSDGWPVRAYSGREIAAGTVSMGETRPGRTGSPIVGAAERRFRFAIVRMLRQRGGLDTGARRGAIPDQVAAGVDDVDDDVDFSADELDDVVSEDELGEESAVLASAF